MAEISPGAVNAQIPLGIQPPHFDPLETVGKYGTVANTLLQNKILQGTLPIQAEQQKQAVTETASQKAKLTQTEADTFIKKATPTSEFFASMLANRDQVPLTYANIKQGAIQNLFGPGFLSAKDPHDTALTDAILGQLAPGNTPEEQDHNAMVLKRGFEWLHSTAEGYGLTMGAPTQIDTGPAKVIARVGGIAQGPTTQAVFQNALSPEQKTETTIPLVNQETGQVTPRTKGEVFDPYGNMLPEAGGGGGMAPTAGGGAGGPRTGRYPGGAGGTAAVGTSSLPVGGAEAMTNSATTYQHDLSGVPDLKRSMMAFSEASKALEKAQTGKGSEVMQNLRAVADTYGIGLPFITDTDKAKAYNEADKWLTTALTTEANRLGLGTDRAREMASHAQPGTQTVKAAAMEMLPILKGLKAMEAAAPLAAQREGVPPQKYVEWRANWANSLDPTAFGADMMTASKRKSLIAGMDKEQKARYARGLKAALQAGIFTLDDLK